MLTHSLGSYTSTANCPLAPSLSLTLGHFVRPLCHVTSLINASVDTSKRLTVKFYY